MDDDIGMESPPNFDDSRLSSVSHGLASPSSATKQLRHDAQLARKITQQNNLEYTELAEQFDKLQAEKKIVDEEVKRLARRFEERGQLLQEIDEELQTARKKAGGVEQLEKDLQRAKEVRELLTKSIDEVQNDLREQELRNEKLTTDYKQLSAKNDALRTRNTQLEAAAGGLAVLDKLKSRNSQLERKLSEMAETQKHAVALSEEFEGQQESYRKEIAELERKVSENTRVADHAEAKANAAESELRELTKKFESAAADLTREREKFADSQKQIAELSQSNASLQSKLDLVSKEHATASLELSRLQAQHAKAIQEAAASKASEKAAQMQAEDLRGKISDLQADQVQKEVLVADLQSKTEVLQLKLAESVKSREQSDAERQKQYEQLQAKYKQVEKELEKVCFDRDNALRNVSANEKALEDLNATLAANNVERNALREQLAKAEADKKASEADRAKLQSENENLSTSAKEQQAESTARCDQLENKLKTTESLLATRTSEERSLKTKLEEAQQKVSMLEAAVEASKKNTSSSQADANAKLTEAEKQRQVLAKELEEKMDEHRTALEALTNKYEKKIAELNVQHLQQTKLLAERFDTLSTVSKQLETMQTEFNRLNAKYESLQSENAAVSAERQQLRAELADLSSQIESLKKKADKFDETEQKLKISLNQCEELSTSYWAKARQVNTVNDEWKAEISKIQNEHQLKVEEFEQREKQSQEKLERFEALEKEVAKLRLELIEASRGCTEAELNNIHRQLEAKDKIIAGLRTRMPSFDLPKNMKDLTVLNEKIGQIITVLVSGCRTISAASLLAVGSDAADVSSSSSDVKNKSAEKESTSRMQTFIEELQKASCAVLSAYKDQQSAVYKSINMDESSHAALKSHFSAVSSNLAKQCANNAQRLQKTIEQLESTGHANRKRLDFLNSNCESLQKDVTQRSEEAQSWANKYAELRQRSGDEISQLKLKVSACEETYDRMMSKMEEPSTSSSSYAGGRRDKMVPRSTHVAAAPRDQHQRVLRAKSTVRDNNNNGGRAVRGGDGGRNDRPPSSTAFDGGIGSGSGGYDEGDDADHEQQQQSDARISGMQKRARNQNSNLFLLAAAASGQVPVSMDDEVDVLQPKSAVAVKQRRLAAAAGRITLRTRGAGSVSYRASSARKTMLSKKLTERNFVHGNAGDREKRDTFDAQRRVDEIRERNAAQKLPHLRSSHIVEHQLADASLGDASQQFADDRMAHHVGKRAAPSKNVHSTSDDLKFVHPKLTLPKLQQPPVNVAAAGKPSSQAFTVNFSDESRNSRAAAPSSPPRTRGSANKSSNNEKLSRNEPSSLRKSIKKLGNRLKQSSALRMSCSNIAAQHANESRATAAVEPVRRELFPRPEQRCAPVQKPKSQAVQFTVDISPPKPKRQRKSNT